MEQHGGAGAGAGALRWYQDSLQLTSVPLAPSVRSVRGTTPRTLDERMAPFLFSSSLLLMKRVQPAALNPPPHLCLSSRARHALKQQKLQRAGFVSVRDVKKTHGPVELALGARHVSSMTEEKRPQI